MEQNLFAYIGEPDQLMSVRDARLLDGRQDGVRMIQVDNGGALECTLLPGRAMDLYQVRYKGANLNYIAPASPHPRTMTPAVRSGCAASTSVS